MMGNVEDRHLAREQQKVLMVPQVLVDVSAGFNGGEFKNSPLPVWKLRFSESKW